MYICLCLGVTSHDVTDAIKAGAITTKQVAAETGASSQCGRCRRNIRAIIDAVADGSRPVSGTQSFMRSETSRVRGLPVPYLSSRQPRLCALAGGATVSLSIVVWGHDWKGASMELGACFAREGGGGFVPGSTARGGWVGGRVRQRSRGWWPIGMGARTRRRRHRYATGQADGRLAEPMALEPVELHTEILRDGRRLRLIEASLAQRGAIVAKASGLFLRRCEQPGGDVWSPQVVMPPLPSEDDVAAAALFIRTYGWGGAPMQNPDQDWSGEAGRKYTWLNMTQPAVDGEELTPFVRAAMAGGDITASLANWGGTAGLKFINADYTVTLSRLPQGPVLGLAAEAHHSFDGVATGSATLVDTEGPVGGTCVAVALAHSGFRVPQG